LPEHDSSSLDDIINSILKNDSKKEWQRKRWTYLASALLLLIYVIGAEVNPDTRAWYKQHKWLGALLLVTRPFVLGYYLRNFMNEPDV